MTIDSLRHRNKTDLRHLKKQLCPDVVPQFRILARRALPFIAGWPFPQRAILRHGKVRADARCVLCHKKNTIWHFVNWINKNCNDVWLLQGRKLVFYDFLVLPQNKHTRMFPWSEEEQILTSISLPCNIFIVSLKTKRRMQASLAFALMLFCSMNQTRESLWQRKNISRALIRNFLQTPKHLTQFAENENTWCELTPEHALALKAKTTLNYCDWQLIT